MINTLSLKQLRPELPQVIDSIHEKFDRFIITKRGKPVVVMMSVDDYDSLMETLDILADKETMKRLLKGEDEIIKGETKSWQEVKQSHA